jgi:ABC-type glycerol-3-phosphate transport system substrate-binding protein
MFPVPNEPNQTATIMGGLMLSIPETSTHKDLAWGINSNNTEI